MISTVGPSKINANIVTNGTKRNGANRELRKMFATQNIKTIRTFMYTDEFNIF